MDVTLVTNVELPQAFQAAGVWVTNWFQLATRPAGLKPQKQDMTSVPVLKFEFGQL